MDAFSPDANQHHKPSETYGLRESKGVLFSDVLTPEQQALIPIERQIGSLVLSDRGEILLTNGVVGQDARTEEWLTKKGVLSAGLVNNTLAVVYNAAIERPEDIPELLERGRAGEFDPEKEMTYTDVSGTYSYLDEKYNPAWVQQNVRHELRHALVDQQDKAHALKVGGRQKRVLDQDHIRETNPNELRELAYLDELHAQFLDVIEGDIKGRTSFRTIESRFYSTEDEGSHLKVASATPEGKTEAEQLFIRLQCIILLQRMGEAGHMLTPAINTLSYATGAVLATERSLAAARTRIDALWEEMLGQENIRQDLTAFINTYEPKEGQNTPEITDSLRDALALTKNPPRQS